MLGFKADTRYFYGNQITQVFNKICTLESTAPLKPLKPQSWLLTPNQLILFFSSFLQVSTKFLFWEEDWVLGYNSIKFSGFPDLS